MSLLFLAKLLKGTVFVQWLVAVEYKFWQIKLRRSKLTLETSATPSCAFCRRALSYLSYAPMRLCVLKVSNES